MSPVPVVALSVVTFVSIGLPLAPMPVPAVSVTVPPVRSTVGSAVIAPEAVMLTALRAPSTTLPPVLSNDMAAPPDAVSNPVLAVKLSDPPE